jgi:hypothetical protein
MHHWPSETSQVFPLPQVTKCLKVFASYQWITPVILATQEEEIGRMWLVHGTKSLKYLMEERADGMIAVVDQLPGKHEALSSNSITDPLPHHSRKSLETQSSI